jgi:DNA-binding Xre family transcriptional regulator
VIPHKVYEAWSREVAQQLGVLVQEHHSRAKVLLDKEPWVALCVSKSHYHKLRRGVADNLQVTTLLALCDALDVQPEQLFYKARRTVRAQHEGE